ncbi:MAG: efflux RND transporter periplasmic adaptor subunit [Holophagales bacterium]|jgi:RND family efflux transporter MFP subunit|nr:efflux RND transporter periplasmic adaptor subunit [Holophagales bacterium]
MKRNSWFYICIAAVIAIGGGSCYYFRGEKEDVKWRFGKLERGDIRQRVSATGTLSAVLEVDVGTQVSGMVTSLNADFNSIVKKDQVIATIDTTIHSQQVRTEEINVDRAKTSLDDAERQYKRYQALADQKLVSESDLETREVAYRTAKASYDNALISLEKAKANLGYCTIKAPVDGVVVSRKADMGQTVTASMSTPSLFIIAQDLRQMKLEITIDEADIAQVNVGQRASFTVDSIPETQFSGVVSQVRLEPINNQNVVSYTVVVEVQNQTKQELEEQKERRQATASGGGARPESQVLAGDKENRPDPARQETKTAGEAPKTEGQKRPVGAESPDYDAMWETMKDRVQERQPGITREAWIQQAKERRAQMDQPGSREARAAQRAVESATASGIFKSGGPFYQGDYVLRPGMTANVTITTNQKNGVLRVPNTALRFDPTPYIKDDPAPANQAGQGGGAQPQGQQGSQGANQQDRRARLMDRGIVAKREDRVWILDERRKPKAVVVKAGLTDGQFTEITCESLDEGIDVMIGVDEVKKNAASAASPFQMGTGGGGGRR